MLRFEGVMQPGTSGVEGALTANGPDLRRLAAWGGNPIGEGENLKPFSVKGKFTYANHATAFNNAAVTLDAVSGRGDIVIETSSRKPLITGRLELAALDLNPYLSRVSAAPAPPSAAAPAVSAVPPKASGLQPVDVRKVGYDETPLDYTGLRDFNVSLDLTTGVLQVQKLRIDRAQLNVQLIDGFLAASINTMELYGGKGQAKVRIDARAEPLRFEETLDVDGVRTLSFLSDALGFGNLDSTANLTLAMKAEGRSQADLIKTLSGSGAFYFADGAFKGVDFGGVTRTVKNVISGRIAGKDAQTPFTNFAATVQIAHGVVATRDFKLNGPRLLVNALGVIDMGGQSLDLRFTPRTVFSRKQSGEAKVTGLPLPVRAIGPWTALKYKLDVTGSGKREEERDICAVIKSAECR
jgi:AsmA protein